MAAPPTTDPQTILEMEDQVARLIAVMALLRHPQKGCPWDREQTLASLKPYLVEETYEVLDAIDSGDPNEICTELGDVLLQIAFQSQIASEAGWFDFHDVAESISRKLIRRHPHVFGDSTAQTPDDVIDLWEATKRKEKAGAGLLDGVPHHLPALQKAHRMTEKAARVGFDWPDITGVLDKVSEEAGELVDAATLEEQEAEFGDLIFALANLARHLKIDPEVALQKTNRRFQQRFRHVEKGSAARGRELTAMSLAEMDELWEEAKRIERKDG
jgi:MazG family protein